MSLNTYDYWGIASELFKEIEEKRLKQLIEECKKFQEELLLGDIFPNLTIKENKEDKENIGEL